MNPSKMKPALIGGVAMGVSSAIPFVGCLNCACCALLIGGGVLAAMIYLKEAPPTGEAPYGEGLVVGLMAGVFGSLIYTMLSTIFSVIMGLVGYAPDISDLEKVMGDAPPQLIEFIETMSSGGFQPGKFFITLILSLVIFSIFGAVGGAIGAAIFKKDA